MQGPLPAAGCPMAPWPHGPGATQGKLRAQTQSIPAGPSLPSSRAALTPVRRLQLHRAEARGRGARNEGEGQALPAPTALGDPHPGPCCSSGPCDPGPHICPLRASGPLSSRAGRRGVAGWGGMTAWDSVGEGFGGAGRQLGALRPGGGQGGGQWALLRACLVTRGSPPSGPGGA